MSVVSVYRRWRPQTFEEVIGQQRITRTLQNALRAGRVTHAYLFTGHRGTGKTTLARILAKALNCERGPTPEPDNTCAACVAITQGTSLDVIEIDGASHTQVDHIRDLKERIVLAPAEGRYKVYIIDEVHMLSTSAFNALLKTLEEPPPHAVFVLVTTEPHRIPPTVASRCQRFDFRRVPLREIEERLRRIAREEGFRIDEAALRAIARLADGSVRDAESILDQVSAYREEGITAEDVLAILGAPTEETLQALAGAVLRRGSAYAAMRRSITWEGTPGEKGGAGTAAATLKLFNLVARELGPGLLAAGVRVPGEALCGFLERSFPGGAPAGDAVRLDGRPSGAGPWWRGLPPAETHRLRVLPAQETESGAPGAPREAVSPPS